MGLTAGNGAAPEFSLKTPDGDYLDDATIAGVWWRRTRSHEIPPAVADPDHRFCAAEGRALCSKAGSAASATASSIRSAPNWRRGASRPTGRGRAARLRIPNSVVTTNDRDRLAALTGSNTRLIYKPLTATDWQLTETRRAQRRRQSQPAFARGGPGHLPGVDRGRRGPARHHHGRRYFRRRNATVPSGGRAGLAARSGYRLRPLTCPARWPRRSDAAGARPRTLPGSPSAQSSAARSHFPKSAAAS